MQYKTIQREKEKYFKTFNLFLKLIHMGNKDTGIQYFHDFRKFKYRVLRNTHCIALQSL